MAGQSPPKRMLIEISDPTLVPDLLDFLRRAECVVQGVQGGRIQVSVPRAYSPAQARLEIDLYLATWRARHPGVTADLRD
jgi:hypothetical protein